MFPENPCVTTSDIKYPLYFNNTLVHLPRQPETRCLHCHMYFHFFARSVVEPISAVQVFWGVHDFTTSEVNAVNKNTEL